MAVGLLHKNEDFDYAVVYDDRVEFHLTSKTVKTAQRNIDVSRALTGRTFCGCCGNSLNRMNQANGKIRICKNRASDKSACKVRSILEAELLDMAADALGHPDNLNMRIYCDISKIEVHETTVTIQLKGGEVTTWKRK